MTPLAVLEEIWAGAREAGLPVHLDGARVFNAATALGISVAKLTSGFDTVMFCLSKGLGAPVGSMLVGSRKAIEQARVHRKALGGGMRQAVFWRRRDLIALHEMPKRLDEDHANARLLAEAVAAHPKAAEIDLEAVQTNIVIFKLRGKTQNGGDAAAFTAALKQKGVLVSAIGPHSVRFVTHYDVDRAACEKAAAIVSEQLRRLVRDSLGSVATGVDGGIRGEKDADDGAVRGVAGVALERDGAAVLVDDAAADPEAQAGSVLALGGEEGLEEVGPDVVRDAGAVVRDGHRLRRPASSVRSHRRPQSAE